MHPAVFLDRDNTLIANDGDLGDPDQVRLLEGVTTGLMALREAGYRLVVVSNQGGVARGAFTEAAVEDVNRRIDHLVREEALGRDVIDRFYYCPFHPDATRTEYRRDHPWRKPNPGMLLQAAGDLDLDLARSWMVGDQERDVVAGQSAGCRTVLVCSEPPSAAGGVRSTAVAACFAEAVSVILRSTPPPARPSPEQMLPPPRRTDQSRGPAEIRGGSGGSIGPANQDVADGRGRAPKAPRRADSASVHDPLGRAVTQLVDELRSQRQRRSEFGAVRAAAGICQLAAILLALLGLLSLDEWEAFARWMLGALMSQLITISLLLVDLRP